MTIAPACSRPDAWLALRAALWPDCPSEEHRREIDAQTAEPARYAAFVATDASCGAIGLIEVALRHDYVNGTRHSPVGFIEGLYVAPAHRRSGVAGRLLGAAKDWSRDRGCAELASDTALDNLVSQQAHQALGFEETERVVFYRMAL
ncbi:aminoglycoside 6'-N-acetyltransferase [Chromobacterium violaceum]|uniref:aminoglycoside 6'-N-acetyltransferase n=1 Tax=Chromobacterium violaceum TaxID=536 RepID=UPI0009DABEE1|nr:aminoglycoside 6'-N-acetyltransferase [Chromobacterium violaceum]OQS46557.1 aminoglycoside 6'-acetyltransferase [Chromobacterium violaceum]OQS49095.1 aminoglycoside 6'-acetyltransferase [Chromobacterium violaceum]QRO31879.1 GNAT family N-acetyltransferase [Chromobacterium violaceum]QRQ18321.1 GNAT family N-acetyltransferase [Chromobacterium violaceum]